LIDVAFFGSTDMQTNAYKLHRISFSLCSQNDFTFKKYLQMLHWNVRHIKSIDAIIDSTRNILRLVSWITVMVNSLETKKNLV